MTAAAELARLERELERVEDEYLPMYAARDGTPPTGRELELAGERRGLVARIIDLEEQVYPAVRAEREGLAEEARYAWMSWHRRRREEQLRREWERWRYQRSRLPAEKRGRMMQPGWRQCRWCGNFFEPKTLRQRYCIDSHRKLAHKARAKGST